MFWMLWSGNYQRKGTSENELKLNIQKLKLITQIEGSNDCHQLTNLNIFIRIEDILQGEILQWTDDGCSSEPVFYMKLDLSIGADAKYLSISYKCDFVVFPK